MTADEFKQWLADMQSAGLARSDAECGRLLGVSKHGILLLKKQGVTGHTAKRTRLACAALLKGEVS